MYLAHGYGREDGHVGLDHPDRFPLTFEFLSATQRNSATASIAQVRHLVVISGSRTVLTIKGTLAKASLTQETACRVSIFGKHLSGLWI